MLLIAAHIQIQLQQFLSVFDLQANSLIIMKLPIFFMFGSFAHNQQAESMAYDSSDLINSRIRHWAMPNYRQMGTIEVEKEFVKPKYNRLSHRKYQELRKLLETLDTRAPRISSIWHSYTKSLF